MVANNVIARNIKIRAKCYDFLNLMLIVCLFNNKVLFQHTLYTHAGHVKAKQIWYQNNTGNIGIIVYCYLSRAGVR